jgi:phosphatidylinositol dimannoside acyltransferase
MWLLRILRIVAILTPFIPAKAGYGLCFISGLIFFIVNANARRNVIANLRYVSEDATWFELRRNAARVCITVATNYYDLIRLRSVDRDTVLDLAQIEGIEHVESAVRCQRGVIIVSGHIGNFSVMARLPSVMGYRAALIAERIDPPELFRYMVRLRSALGIDVIPPGAGSLKRVIQLLSQNGILLLAADRDVNGSSYPVSLFGVETTLPDGPVILAMRTGAALIPAFTWRRAGQRSDVLIGPPFELQRTGNWEADLAHNMQLLANELESMIRRDPGQWAVLQRVWPPTSHYGRSEGLGSLSESGGLSRCEDSPVRHGH